MNHQSAPPEQGWEFNVLTRQGLHWLTLFDVACETKKPSSFNLFLSFEGARKFHCNLSIGPGSMAPVKFFHIDIKAFNQTSLMSHES